MVMPLSQVDVLYEKPSEVMYTCDGCGEDIVWLEANMLWLAPKEATYAFCAACEKHMLLSLEGRLG